METALGELTLTYLNEAAMKSNVTRPRHVNIWKLKGIIFDVMKEYKGKMTAIAHTTKNLLRYEWIIDYVLPQVICTAYMAIMACV